MGRVQTQAEVEAEHLEKLGPELGPVFSKLGQELAWLQIIWMEFKELYGANDKRLELINKSAKFFFYVVQQTMLHEICLRIRRLTDPPKSAGKENLTIMRLADLCADPELADKVRALAEDANAKSQFAKSWRDREIAHADLRLALGNSPDPLPAFSRKEIGDAIAAIHLVLNTISMRLMRAEIHDEPLTGHDGSLALLYVLRKGVKAQDERRQRRENRQYTADDLKPGEPL